MRVGAALLLLTLGCTAPAAPTRCESLEQHTRSLLRSQTQDERTIKSLAAGIRRRCDARGYTTAELDCMLAAPSTQAQRNCTPVFN